MGTDKRKVSEKNPTHLDIINPVVPKKKKFTNTEKNKEGLKKNLRITKQLQKAALLKELEKTLGIVTTACRNVGCATGTHYNYMNEDPEYKAAVDAIENIALDFVESNLHKQISKGKDACIIFYLKTKGKKRGYIERIENEHVIRQAYDLSRLTDEELLMFSTLQAKMESNDQIGIGPSNAI